MIDAERLPWMDEQIEKLMAERMDKISTFVLAYCFVHKTTPDRLELVERNTGLEWTWFVRIREEDNHASRD